MRHLALLLLAGCVQDLDDGLVSGEGLGDTSIEFNANATVCASGSKTAGVDVSYYQGTVSWSKVAAAGIKFAFMRVSDGTAAKDSKFATNWAGAQAAGVIRGAYQYFRPGQNVTTQANMMIAAIGHYTPGDLPPVLDVEATDGLGPATVASKVNQWMTQVSSALGVKPIIYSGYYFWRDQVGNPATYASNAFWIAQYTSASCATIPSVWSKWTFWQHSDSGHVNGISGNVDLDWFNGSLAQLQAFAGTAATPDPTPDPDPTPTPTGARVQLRDARPLRAVGQLRRARGLRRRSEQRQLVHLRRRQLGPDQRADLGVHRDVPALIFGLAAMAPRAPWTRQALFRSEVHSRAARTKAAMARRGRERREYRVFRALEVPSRPWCEWPACELPPEKALGAASATIAPWRPIRK